MPAMVFTQLAAKVMSMGNMVRLYLQPKVGMEQ